MQLKCKNPLCEYDLRNQKPPYPDFTKGWCKRCSRLAQRNGVQPSDSRVPMYRGRAKVDFSLFVEGAIKRKLSMINFLWEYKLSLDDLCEFQNKEGVDYEESRIHGKLVFL